MEAEGSKSKGKRPKRVASSGGLRPGEWRGSKRARSVSSSRSPSETGVSTSGELSADESVQPNQNTTRDPAVTIAGAATPTPAQNSTGNTWSGLEEAFRKLRIASNICPPFCSVVEGLASCLHIFEEAAKNRQDYDDLATGLKSVVGLLVQHLNAAPSEDIIESISAISEVIRKEIESIGARQSRNGLRRVLGSSGDEEDLIRRYRRIEQLFRQLQGEASMSTWNITSKQYINTQLESLHPAKLARFDSNLSSEISRRTCTENTRTAILQQSMEWADDSGAAKIYWMNGMAGTGKTTIACSLCEKLDACKQLAASFFCTRTSPECREAKRIIPTIAYQFARRSTPFRSALCKALEDDPDISAGNVPSQFDLLLKRPLMKVKEKLPNNLVVIVDALDECSDPHIVELFLGLLFRSITDLPIKFYVTSRPEPAIRNRMMTESAKSRSILYLHEIEQSLVQADIELYLKEELAFMLPTESAIKELAERAGNLFIYAATAVRYICPPGLAVNSWERLATILAVNTESTKKLSDIDSLYSAILAAAINNPKLEPVEQDRIRLVLWTAICALEPILINTLSRLCGVNIKDSTIAALQPLRSVLHISDHSEVVTTLHASFPDYMLDHQRSGAFYCDQIAHGRFLAQRCFEIMQAQLRFNVCSIDSSFIPDDRIPELGKRIRENISEDLFYTCRFWADHLSQTTLTDELLVLVDQFLSQRLLFWMEVLNLKKCLPTGVLNMMKLNTWLAQAGVDEYPNLPEFALDAHIFVAGYTSRPISMHTPHIYLSALPLTAPSNTVRLCYMPKFKGLIKVSGTIMNELQQPSLGAWESTHPLRAAAFSPHGDFIVLGNDTGKISVQNAYDGKYIVQPFKGHKKVVTSIAISSDSRQIVSGSNDMTLSIWNARDGSIISGPFRGHTSRVTSVAFSPDAAHVASGSDDCTIGIWNPLNPASPMRRLTGHSKAVKSVAFSPDGTRIISGSLDHTIRVWDLSTGTTVLHLQHHCAPVSSVQYSSDGEHIISGSNDYTICIWDASDGNMCGQLQGHSDRVTSIAVSPDGDNIASGSFDHTVRVWSRRTGQLIAGPFTGHIDSIRSVGFSGDGTRIVSASDDKVVRVWDVHGRVQQAGEHFHDTIDTPSIVFAPNSTHIAAGIFSHIAHVWDLRSTMLVNSFQFPTSKKIFLAQFSMDGARVLCMTDSGTICIWDVYMGQIIDGPHDLPTMGPFRTALCSTDLTRIVTCDAQLQGADLWNVQLRQLVKHAHSAEGPQLGELRVSFPPGEGRRYLTWRPSSDSLLGRAYIWDLERGAYFAGPIAMGFPLAFSPQATHVFHRRFEATPEQHFQLLNLEDGEAVDAPFEPWSSNVSHATFSSDGTHLVFRIDGIDDSNYIWDTQNQAESSRCLKFPNQVGFCAASAISFSSDGWFLVTESEPWYIESDRKIRVRRFQPDESAFTIQPDGWLFDGGSRPLLWIPPELRKTFAMSNAVVIKRNKGCMDSLYIDYSGILIGDRWSECYIGH